MKGIVICVIVFAAVAVGLFQYNKYATRQKAIAYQREVAAQQAAAEKAAAEAKAQKEAEAAKRAAFDAEETAKEKAAKDKAASSRAETEAKKLASESAAANAEQALALFKAGARKFIGAAVAGVWDQGDPSKSAVWCLVPTESGRGSYYEILPGEKGAQVRTLVDGAVQPLTYERFAKEVLSEHATVLLRTADDKVWLWSVNGEPKARKIAVPRMGDEPVNLAALLYGESVIKAIKVYRMQAPKFAWNIAFVTKNGRRLRAGTVAFGETISRDRFVPVVTRALDAEMGKLNTSRERKIASNVFTPSFKRTHFLYDGPAIKRTVEGKTYVPRTEPKWSNGSFRSAKAEQDAARHRDEWIQLHDKAKRQGDREAAERAEWEKAKKAGAKASPALSVNESMVNGALDDGSIVYEPAKKQPGS